ncbi:MAG: Uma2 family endonuclease [Thiofilum sp.]|uniref:Uma2 family endonuclease n=1 Tax=Thiofilum sp. TaxID=2212733 RepID=UPI0025E81A94|nr:Uma2 family endonuclease [Thiofilum sp.]MBK8454989.1 Uma2 family endonuclease [Thiofilum sp.]
MSTVPQASLAYITESEYLEGEKISPERHEYVAGQVYLMAGSSKRHNRIARSFINGLANAASEKNCEIYFSDIKVKIEKYQSYYYPDVVISCDDNDDEYYLTNPCIIIEVASDSTIRKDYLEKSLAYQSIPSLQAYLIVAQDKIQIDMLIRDENNEWQLKKLDKAEEQVYFPCLNASLNLAKIYNQVME